LPIQALNIIPCVTAPSLRVGLYSGHVFISRTIEQEWVGYITEIRLDQYWQHQDRSLFMTSGRKFKELEVVVKFYEYYSIFCSIIPSIICEAGKEALRLRQYILYVYENRIS